MIGERKYGGKLYVLKDWVRTKTKAKDVAWKYRKSGLHLVRIGKIKGGYGLYLRTVGYKGK